MAHFSRCELDNRYVEMKGGLSYLCMSQTMSVPAEKGKAGAHRKGGLVLMWAQRQKQCVSGQERAACGG